MDTALTPVELRADLVEAVKSSPRHSGAGFMATAEDTNSGVAEMGGGLNASTYGDQLWNYFKRSYPDNMERHYPGG